ncbi:MAG: glycosyltransferase [Campylobacterota bacterium]|nr:glycosyltransferase [Campylobacterota bacterium]
MHDKSEVLISVVMATCNGEKYLCEQIDSILGQTHKNIELIICDDASDDGSVEIVERYMKEHTSIKLYEYKHRVGFVKNFERGLALCSAKYIALSDQDDIWVEDKLAILRDEMLHKEKIAPSIPLMVHSDLSVIHEEGKLLYHSYFKRKHYALQGSKDLGHIVGTGGVMGNTILINKHLKEIVLPFPDCIEFHDQWIALNNELFGERVTLFQQLVKYRVHESNSSNNSEKMDFSFISEIQDFLRGEIKPIYLDTSRACMIEKIIEKQALLAEDEKILRAFLVYLTQKGNKFRQLFILWRYDLLKRNLWYRIKFTFNYLLHKKREEKKKMAYFFGFSLWKRGFIPAFFSTDMTILFCATLDEAQTKGLDENAEIYMWGKRSFPLVEAYAKEIKIPIYHVEDGFIRSVSLGSDLTKAYSLVVDRRGIYFDPTVVSDLEHILNTYHFESELLERARDIQRYLKEHRISKYNTGQEKSITLEGLQKDQRIVLIPGQVEDDASIIYGAEGMSNLELMQRTRERVPHAYIIYKPHPDVVAGNRKGRVSKEDVEKYSDCSLTDVGLDSVLDMVDEVHTMTSLVGFEALIRKKRVVTYGLPFYAGWGLTTDTRGLARRTARRTLDELVAATLILYPRYIDPQTDEACEIEVLLEHINKEKIRYNSSVFYRAYKETRNICSRKLQRLIKG